MAFTLDPALKTQMLNLQALYNAELRTYNGLIANIPAGIRLAIADALNVIVVQLAPYTFGADAAEPIRISNLLKIIESYLRNDVQTSIKVVVTNPNLFIEAARYYDDPTLYGLIKKASGLPGPFPPPGDYTLIIPLSGYAQPVQDGALWP